MLYVYKFLFMLFRRGKADRIYVYHNFPILFFLLMMNFGMLQQKFKLLIEPLWLVIFLKQTCNTMM